MVSDQCLVPTLCVGMHFAAGALRSPRRRLYEPEAFENGRRASIGKCSDAEHRNQKKDFSLWSTCPPLPCVLALQLFGDRGAGRRVLAHKLNAASGVGRRE
ncbi:MAG: hypothetical protein JRJ79_06620 [Deltaproteobacteria bacterium]|nr:hypothetical protein [Deltaproteobacteria bacterium]MBW1793075.1 hypothetical protein [Deltaproteobacteria bacterium]